MFAPYVGAGIVHALFRGTVCSGALLTWRLGVHNGTSRAFDGTSSLPQVGVVLWSVYRELRQMLVVGSLGKGRGRRGFESRSHRRVHVCCKTLSCSADGAVFVDTCAIIV